MRVRYSRRFKKQLRKLPIKNQLQFKLRLKLFLNDPRYPLLNIHALSGRYDQCLSMNIGGDLRLIFEYQKNKSKIFLMAIGTRSQLY